MKKWQYISGKRCVGDSVGVLERIQMRLRKRNFVTGYL